MHYIILLLCYVMYYYIIITIKPHYIMNYTQYYALFSIQRVYIGTFLNIDRIMLVLMVFFSFRPILGVFQGCSEGQFRVFGCFGGGYVVLGGLDVN